MSDNTSIEWTDATWNILTGCSVTSPGCANCYAMKLAGTRLRNHPSRKGLTIDSKAGPVWNGQVRFNQQWLLQPLSWLRPRRIFPCAHGDLFHENVPDEWIDYTFAVMALCGRHQFQPLTKRAERMRQYLSDRELPGRLVSLLNDQGPDWGLFDRVIAHGCNRIYNEWPLRNIWLGVSVEDQLRADERIPHLLATPAAIRFVSAEPLLGPIDLTNLKPPNSMIADDAHGISAIWKNNAVGRAWLDWVITGGESGPNARPPNPQWFRDLRDQCDAANVAFLFKQWGEWVSVSEVAGEGEHFTFPDHRTVRRIGKKAAGNHLDGRQHLAFPR